MTLIEDDGHNSANLSSLTERTLEGYLGHQWFDVAHTYHSTLNRYTLAYITVIICHNTGWVMGSCCYTITKSRMMLKVGIN